MKKIDSFRVHVIWRYILLVFGTFFACSPLTSLILGEELPVLLEVFGVIVGIIIALLSQSKITIYDDRFDFTNLGFHKRINFSEIENYSIKNGVINLNLKSGDSQSIEALIERYESMKNFVQERFVSFEEFHSLKKPEPMEFDYVDKFGGSYTFIPLKKVIIKQAFKAIIAIFITNSFLLFSTLTLPDEERGSVWVLLSLVNIYFVFHFLLMTSLKVTVHRTFIEIKSLCCNGKIKFADSDAPASKAWSILVMAYSLFWLKKSVDHDSLVVLQEYFKLNKEQHKLPVMVPKEERIDVGEEGVTLTLSEKQRKGTKAILIITPLALALLAVGLYYIEPILGISLGLAPIVIIIGGFFNKNLTQSVCYFPDRMIIHSGKSAETYFYNEFRYLKKVYTGTSQEAGKWRLVFKDLKRPDLVLFRTNETTLTLLRQAVPYCESEKALKVEMKESRELYLKDFSIGSNAKSMSKSVRRWLCVLVFYLIGCAISSPFIYFGTYKWGNGQFSGDQTVQTFFYISLLSSTISLLFNSLFLVKLWKSRHFTKYPKLKEEHCLLMIIPTIFIFLVGISIYIGGCYDVTSLMLCVLTGYLAFQWLFLTKLKGVYSKKPIAIYSNIVAPLYTIITVFTINFSYDFSEHHEISTKVTEKICETSHKGESYYIIFKDTENGKIYSLKSSKRKHQYAEIGEEAVLYQKSGALGIPWIYDFKILSFD